MIESKIQKIGYTKIPDNFIERELYMFPINLSKKIEIPFNEFNSCVKKMLKNINLKNGVAYVTIDQKNVKKNHTHRRPGPHVDGNYLFSWGGGGGWLCNNKGRKLTEKEHNLQYCNKSGGVLLLSNYEACRAWEGNFNKIPLQGGDCSNFNLDNEKSFILEKNKLYIGNSTFIHESIPVFEDVKRTLIRITLPIEFSL